MGSRARIAAAACLLASGLLVGGVGTASAFADTGTDDTADTRPADVTGPRPAAAEDLPVKDSGTPERPVEPAVPEEGEPQDVSADDDEATPSADPAPDPDVEPVPDGKDEEAAQEDPRPPCCQDGKEDCGWPWPWPWPWPVDPDPDPPTGDGSTGNNGGGRPETVPPIRPMPPIGVPQRPDVLDVVPGVGVGAGDFTEAPISAPIIVVNPIAAPGLGAAGAGAPGAPGGPSSGGASAGLPSAPKRFTTSPRTRQEPLPATTGNTVAMPSAATRVGYGEYLRTAGVSQVAALALPGLAGILILTGAGGLVGYRQAKAGRGVRTSGIARFMN